MADSEPKRLLKPPEQYSPLSKLKFACMTGDVEAVNKLLASGKLHLRVSRHSAGQSIISSTRTTVVCVARAKYLNPSRSYSKPALKLVVCLYATMSMLSISTSKACSRTLRTCVSRG